MQINRSFIFLFLTLTGLLTSFDTPGIPMEDNNEFVVVLDAGHGGHDPGNLGNGYLEKNISLNIVLKVGEALSQHPDIKVVYTRKNDTFVDLYVRGEIANKANADLFVSVHCDSHSSDANGAGTFVLGLHANEQNFEIAKKENSVIYLEDNYETRYAEYDINSPESIIGLTIMQEEFLDQSIMLAKMMQDNFTKKLRRNDRKVKQAGFIVLHQTFMPSVLVETGFLTNRSEGGYLNSKKGQTEMGKAIADAIVHYKENIRATVSEATGSQETEVADFPSADQGQEESRESTQDHVATHVAEKDAEIIQPEEKP
jgi:N-acetylmuramoyl-L-alanine amidase